MTKKKILLVFGTRPEAIKIAPVVETLQADAAFGVKVCVTAQHRQILDQVLKLFDIQPDFELNLNLMKPGQDLHDITSGVLLGVKSVLLQWQPGPRAMAFRPDGHLRDNLLKEGMAPETIHVTGNTVIDALLQAREKIISSPRMRQQFDRDFSFLDAGKRLVLVTGRRRKNFGDGFERICQALARIVQEHVDVQVVYPVHLNPQVPEPVKRLLAAIDNVHLIEPLDYLPFFYLMDKSTLILTGSGGIQEEAPSLGKPVLVMRDTTERPEAVEAGTVRLVGTDAEKIASEAGMLLNDPQAYSAMAFVHNLYGDGHACRRIAQALLTG